MVGPFHRDLEHPRCCTPDENLGDDGSDGECPGLGCFLHLWQWQDGSDLLAGRRVYLEGETQVTLARPHSTGT